MPKPDSDSNDVVSATRRWPDYRTVWRWHFYAGVVCIPFVIWLACTGSIYLFKPQIEAWLDRPYDSLQISGEGRAPSEVVAAALAAVPGGVLNAYELPTSRTSAARVLVGRNVGQSAELHRVYVHPQTLQVLRVVREDSRFMRVIFYLHGELMQGDAGSMIVEAAASWTMMMLITGLYLWWPRGATSLAGVLYPRLRQGKRVFWRDVHASTGLWVSFFAIFLLVSGLPWAKSWGGMLKSVRQLGSTSAVQQDWTTGRSSELAARRAANMPITGGEHAGHHMDQQASVSIDYSALDRVVPTVMALELLPPVLVSPPSQSAPEWNARSDTQNRPRRVTLTLDGTSGQVVSRQDFSQRPLMDRVVGVGVAAHEGQLFAPINQVLGLFTAVGLVTLACSAIVLWWRRKPDGVLGAPAPLRRPRLAMGVFGVVALMGVLLPLFGATLLILLALERMVFQRHAGARKFLGLGAIANS